MRFARHSIVTLVAAVALAVPAHGATVADVYADYAGDGRLDGSYPTTVLEDVVEGTTVFRYGDPLTASRLRRVVRRTLAAGVPLAAPPPAARETPAGGSAESAGAQAATAIPGAPAGTGGATPAPDERTADAAAAAGSRAGAAARADAGAVAGAVTAATADPYAVTPLTILLGIAAIGFGAGSITIVVARAHRFR